VIFLLQENKRNSIIFSIILFVVSYSVLSFNLENQGISLDEVYHHGNAMGYFDLVMEGKISDPCFTGKGECDLFNLPCMAQGENTMHWITHGGLFKAMFAGFGDYLFSDSERVYYSSVYVEPCRPLHKGGLETGIAIRGENIPTQSELAAGRFFTPIFGSLTVVIGFFLGKLLFNRFVGLSFSVVIIFHSLWMHFSRTLNPEVYTNFLIILSIFLILYGLQPQKKSQLKYLILSAITFALAINSRLTSFEILPFLIIVILFRESFDVKINFTKLKNKRFAIKSFLLILIFIGVLFSSIFLTFPFYYPDPIGQLMLQYDTAMKYENLNAPSEHLKKVFLPMVESATIAPIIDGYYYIFSPDSIPRSAQYGHTFSSIPLSIFFVVGMVYLFLKIIRKDLLYSEFLIIFWYLTIYTILSLVMESYNLTRHFIPIIFPMSIIMGYGFWHFLKFFKHKKTKIVFFGIFIFSHAVTFLTFWEWIYFSPNIVWDLPTEVSLLKSLSNPEVFYSGIVFLVAFFIIFGYKMKLKIIKNNYSE